MRRVTSRFPNLPASQLRAWLSGLPATDYDVQVKPLRYRTRAHLAALTDFEARQIVIQIPEPFLRFKEDVHYAARRRPGRTMRFSWLSESVTFRTRREVVRFLYCHEWMHWYLKERLGQKSAAETACDRFALRNYRRARVTIADAEAALRRLALPLDDLSA
jgi:hypothetical protein